MAGHKPLVLLVEDEPAQRRVLAYNLEAAGCRVSLAEDGEQALLSVAETPPDLVVLDWMLPNVSGIEVCRQLKAREETRAIPVIILSARSEEEDRVRGLDIGADDYVVKPYSVAEFMARVRSHLRRNRIAGSGATLQYDDIIMDAETHRVSRSGQEITLGPTEYRLLAAFLERPGRVFSRDVLMDKVWGRDIYIDSRTVDVHVGRLRKALRQYGGKDPLRTVRGTGYALG